MALVLDKIKKTAHDFSTFKTVDILFLNKKGEKIFRSASLPCYNSLVYAYTSFENRDDIEYILFTGFKNRLIETVKEREGETLSEFDSYGSLLRHWLMNPKSSPFKTINEEIMKGCGFKDYAHMLEWTLDVGLLIPKSLLKKISAVSLMAYTIAYRSHYYKISCEEYDTLVKANPEVDPALVLWAYMYRKGWYTYTPYIAGDLNQHKNIDATDDYPLLNPTNTGVPALLNTPVYELNGSHSWVAASLPVYASFAKTGKYQSLIKSQNRYLQDMMTMVDKPYPHWEINTKFDIKTALEQMQKKVG
jgi:hypothetical protein